eukprot:Anaeramoba_ignava/c21660_g3_i1.p1 GENE.c21660_g3_i1~~c21660_g3_i1.p1  ORF type:complete len:100 (+),score=27.85 c21660_g3_i1:55-354(+)
MGNANNIKHKITKASIKKYRKKIYSSQDAVVVVVPQKGFIEANDVAVKLFEASSKEELLKYGPETLSPQFQAHLGKSSQEVVMEASKRAIEFVFFFFSI